MNGRLFAKKNAMMIYPWVVKTIMEEDPMNQQQLGNRKLAFDHVI